MYNVNSGLTNAGARFFYWYRLDKVNTIRARSLRQFTVEVTINRKNTILHTATYYDDTDSERFFLTVEYDGVFIPVGLNDFFPYYLNGYAVDVVEETKEGVTDQVVFLGVEVTE